MTSTEGFGSSYPSTTVGGDAADGAFTPPLYAPAHGSAATHKSTAGSNLGQSTGNSAWSSPGTGSGDPSADSSTAETAKEQVASVAGGAADAAKDVAGVAKEQVTQVAAEAKKQVRDLVGQAQSELADQAQVQQERVAGGLHAVGDQLKAMAEGSDQQGTATDLAHQAAAKAHEVATWLENRDPGSVLNEVRSFARQRPGAFLALALGAGVVTGRLVRGLSADPATTASGNGGPTARIGERPAATLTAGTSAAGYGPRPELGGGVTQPGFTVRATAPATDTAEWPTDWSDGR